MNSPASAATLLRTMGHVSTLVFSRTSRVAASCCAIAGVLLCAYPAAYANGRYPKADQILIAPNDSDFLAARTTFGLLVSHDAGHNWDWICERAIGYAGVQDPTIGLLDSGTIIASLAEGIARSSDHGCNWAFSEADLGGSPVIDLTVSKDEPNQAFALVWDAQRLGYSSRILASSDDGNSFSLLGTPIDPSVLVATIEVAPSNPHRVYASGTRSVDGVRSGLLFASDDDGEHWSEYSLPFDPKLEQGVYIAAVDPHDADTVYLRTSSATVGRLLVSHDAGKRVSVVYSGSLLAFALSPDGKQLYVGGQDGVHAGLANDLSFERRASLRVLCLASTADTVYACSDEYSGFTVGASRDGGSTFEPLLHLQTVRGPLSCSAAQCQSDWPLVRAQLGIPQPSEGDVGTDADDASTADAGDEGDLDDPPVRPPTAARSSCTLRFTNSTGTPWFEASLLALAGLGWRRRSRQRSRLRAK